MTIQDRLANVTESLARMTAKIDNGDKQFEITGEYKPDENGNKRWFFNTTPGINNNISTAEYVGKVPEESVKMQKEVCETPEEQPEWHECCDGCHEYEPMFERCEECECIGDCETCEKPVEMRGKAELVEEDDFGAVLDKVYELHELKAADYGPSFDELWDEYGVTSLIIRLSDKLNRLKQLTRTGVQHVKDESIADTLLDICSYSALGLCAMQRDGVNVLGD